MGDTLINIISASNLDDLDFFTNTSNSTCQSNSPCLNPNFLNAGNITPNSADLLWQAGGNETSWNLEWGTSGFNLGGEPSGHILMMHLGVSRLIVYLKFKWEMDLRGLLN